ncbi:MAG: cupin domain-containing protein [Gemmatimonadaceae bacterium]
MNTFGRMVGPALVIGLAGLAGYHVARAQGSTSSSPPQSAAQVRVAFTQSLPKLDGEKLVMRILEVTYPPGGVSTPHRHPCAVVGYILEGAMRMRVSDRAETIYTVGQSFFEGPDDVHRVSANASDSLPARFLAYFTCDRETPLSIPVPDAGRGKNR